MNKKIISLILGISMVLPTGSQIFALSNNNASSTSIIFNNSDMSPEELQAIFKEIENKDYDINKMNDLEKEIFNELVENSFNTNSDLAYTEENKEIILTLLNENNTSGSISFENNNVYFRSAAKPKVRIKNSHAAAAFNTIIGAVIGGATGKVGVAAVNALIKKMGKKAAIDFVKNRALSQIKNKLIYWGMSGTASKVSSFLGSALYNLIDPGTALAKLLDKNDKWGANGYIEI